ncbi:uncharacterized protein LOC131630970 [Vicia villosa]|uniref:uncharacterized protein LOC131630970 n=1 Tax=Vicia villosa TaxID=3911 RepID=UPI00273A774F|nr:uncharacterized protein LOC131630970 [Vicia villosa]
MIKESQVSSAWSGSKLLINEDIPEISEFLSKLPANEQNQKPSQSAKSMSLWSGGSQFTTLEKFVHKAKCIPLSELTKIKQVYLKTSVFQYLLNLKSSDFAVIYMDFYFFFI